MMATYTFYNFGFQSAPPVKGAINAKFCRRASFVCFNPRPP